MEVQLTSNKDTNIYKGLRTGAACLPAILQALPPKSALALPLLPAGLASPSPTGSPAPGRRRVLRAATQFARAVSTLGLISIQLQHCLAACFKFIWIYNWGNLFLYVSAKQPAAVRAGQGQSHNRQGICLKSTCGRGLFLSVNQQDNKIPAATCLTCHPSSAKLACQSALSLAVIPGASALKTGHKLTSLPFFQSSSSHTAKHSRGQHESDKKTNVDNMGG